MPGTLSGIPAGELQGEHWIAAGVARQCLQPGTREVLTEMEPEDRAKPCRIQGTDLEALHLAPVGEPERQLRHGVALGSCRDEDANRSRRDSP